MFPYTAPSHRSRRTLKRAFVWFVVPAALLAATALPALAAQVDTGLDVVGETIGLSATDPRIIVARVIRTFLGLLGMLGVGIVLYGGVLWMTANGDETKITKAKQVLINGGIGLVLVLTSFSIAQFVLTKLVEATGEGGGGTTSVAEVCGNDIDDDGDGLIDEGCAVIPPPSGCADPGGTDPHICSIAPTEGPSGTYVTLRGYRFGAYNADTSMVRFDDTPAAIVACAGAPNWSETLVVVEVPELDPASYTVTLERGDGASTVFGGAGLASGYTVTAGALTAPQIACVVPNEGPEGQEVRIEGKRFRNPTPVLVNGGTPPAVQCEPDGSNNCGIVRFTGDPDRVPAQTTAWSDTEITASVPVGALVGDADVTVDTSASNPYPFRVTCTADAQCGVSNCCIAKACYEASRCGGGEGAPCGTIAAGICTADDTDCATGFQCRADTCTCTSVVAEEEPTILAVSPAHRDVSGAVPADACDPTDDQTACTPNGAVGNFITIFGNGFGETPGTVTIAGETAALPAACVATAAWTDTAIIVAVPNTLTSAAVGPIIVEADSGKRDATDDARGPAIPDFIVNTVARPALCSATPAAPGDRTSVLTGYESGQFIDVTNLVFHFGDAAFPSTDILVAGLGKTLRPLVPLSLAAPQDDLSLVAVTSDGERSNVVPFDVLSPTTGATVLDVDPPSGPLGSYVTMTGSRFGATGSVRAIARIGSNTRTYTLRSPPPEQCAASDMWTDTQITIRIPENPADWVPENGAPALNASQFPRAWSLQVVPDGGVASQPPHKQFTVTTEAPLPGICSIAPTIGPVGTIVTLRGERFGAAEGIMHFFSSVEATVTTWSDTTISGTVPTGAVSGPVRVWASVDDPDAVEDPATPARENRGSNAVGFTVGSCAAEADPDAACGSQFCCLATGTCVTSPSQCEVVPNVGAYQWTFKTGVTPPPPVVPRVVESCEAHSPSPWDMHPDGDACTNALVNIQFNMGMSITDETAGTHVIFSRCNNDVCTPEDTVQWRVDTDRKVITGYPNIPWTQNTTYEVLVCGTTHTGAESLGGCSPIQSDNAVPVALGANEDGTGGEDYRFRFHTGAGGCVIDGVAVKPKEHTATQPWPVGKGAADLGVAPLTVDHPGLTHYTAFPTSRDGACQVLDPRGNTWAWSVTQPDDEAIYAQASATGGRWATSADQCDPNSFAANRCTGDPYTTTARAFVETPSDPVVISATTTTTTTRPATAWCGDGAVSGIEACDGDAIRPCVVGSNDQGVSTFAGNAINSAYGVRGADGSDLLANGMAELRGDGSLVLYQNGSWEYPVAWPGGGGQARVSITYANDPPIESGQASDMFAVSEVPILNQTQIESGNSFGDFFVTVDDQNNPRVDVHTTSFDTSQPFDTFRYTWSNDGTTSGGTDLNLRIISVQFTASQRRSCEDPASANACTWQGAWRACAASTLTCDAGDVEVVDLDGTRRCTIRTNAPPSAVATITGSANLAVNFDEFRVVEHFPAAGCAEACTNATLAAVMSAEFDTAGTLSMIGAADMSSPATDATWDNDIGLFKCANSACFSGGLTPVVGTTAEAYNDTCTNCIPGGKPQILITPPVPLDPRSFYRVVLRNTLINVYGRPLSLLNYTTPNSPTTDAYSWTFQTGEGTCGITRVAVAPDPLVFRAVGEIRTISAKGYSRPDSCGADGQPINSAAQDWGWGIDSAAVAGFVAPTADGWSTSPGVTGTLATAQTPDNRCTLQCLPMGSRRVYGVCRNGSVETGEDCDRGTETAAEWASAGCDYNRCVWLGSASANECGNGVINTGEECDRMNDDGELDPSGQFEKCHATQCLNLGTTAPECGDGGGTPDPGEDCDNGGMCTNGTACTTTGTACSDGSSCMPRGGDGCSARCLNEGTSTIVAVPVRCGDSTVGPGEDCDLGTAAPAAWASAGCDYNRCVALGKANTCGDGTIADGKRTNGTTITYDCNDSDKPCDTNHAPFGGEQCDDGNITAGDGCSSVCLLEGASLRYAQPSICGDGITGTGESAACESGLTMTIDPLQFLRAVGEQTVSPGGTQETIVTATATVAGTATVRLQCGFFEDSSCLSGSGVAQNGCCALRPTRTAWIPTTTTNLCRNQHIGATFNQQMDPGSVGLILDRENPPVPVGAVLEVCIPPDPLGAGVTVDSACDVSSTDTTLWKPVGVPRFTTVCSIEGAEECPENAKVSELDFIMPEGLAANTYYRVRILGNETVESVLRSATGVRFGASERQRFHVGGTFCTPTSLTITPASVLLQRVGDTASLNVRAYDVRNTEVSSTTALPWEYAWSAKDATVATVAVAGKLTGAACTGAETGNDRCSSRACVDPDLTDDDTAKQCQAPESNATVSIPTAAREEQTLAIVKATGTGIALEASTPVTVFLCEQLWPAVSGGAWAPWPPTNASATITDHHFSTSYCRDAGTRTVCRVPGAPESASAASCTRDDCDNTDEKCLPALRDDLPALDEVAGSGTGSLLERFFLPRTVISTPLVSAQYCSESGARCDSNANCPTGQFCRTGDDAIGLRIFANSDHVPARQWYIDQDFTDVTTPVAIDGYRGVQSGDTTYINIANIDNTNSNNLYTNIATLSVNAGAVDETRTIARQLLEHLRFNTDLDDEDIGICVPHTICESPNPFNGTTRHCRGGIDHGQICATANDCETTVCHQDYLWRGTCSNDGTRACIDASVDCPVAPVLPVTACSSDLDCRVGTLDGICASPKDKLRRDTQRVEDLTVFAKNLATYETGTLRTPDLATGTFIPGITTSKWPSWQQELGRVLGTVLPIDPLNVFGGPCVTDATNERYEQATCWNERGSQYTRPEGSYLYEYQRGTGLSATIRAWFEFVVSPKRWVKWGVTDATTTPPTEGPIENLHATIAENAFSPTPYGATGLCGDGVIQGSEACEPSTSPPTSEACTTAAGASGNIASTCKSDCTWNVTACTTACGNSVVDTGTTEQCDVGAAGGRVPATAGTIPGITAGTAYACGAANAGANACKWTGGYCGDDVVQAGFSEDCDGDVGIATTRQQSSPNRHYACTAKTIVEQCGGNGSICTINSGCCPAGTTCNSPTPEQLCVQAVPASSISTEKRCGGDGIVCTADTDCAALPSAQRSCIETVPCQFAQGYCGDGTVQESSTNAISEQCEKNAQESCIVGGSDATGVVTILGSRFDAGGGADSGIDGLHHVTEIVQDAYDTRWDGGSPSTINGYPNARFATSDTVWYIPMDLRAESDVRVVLQTSNNDASVASVSMRLHPNAGKFNPDGSRGIGVYHRLYLAGGGGAVNVPDPDYNSATSSMGALTTDFFGPFWVHATAPNNPQWTEILLEDMPANTEYLILVWNNDFEECGASASGTCTQPQSSNFTLHRVELQSMRTRPCGAPGTSNACLFDTATACTAQVLCGNGIVDNAVGEQCDDGGAGRCMNDLSQSCAADADCGPADDLSAKCGYDLDTCTSQCRLSVCGDGALLTGSVCVGGARSGQACTSNVQCGADSTCRSEACDEGGANFSDALLQSAACLRYDGRCNYCTTQCTVATKQGGFCGDGVVNGPEQCDGSAGVTGTQTCTSTCTIAP
ncbi:MAG: IPT/TIG domain-containing protein [bacterium]|nr:IPT/TIG domain-containing protein [bacterium]